MSKEQQNKEPAISRFLTPEGKPLRVLSTSLGVALLANALLIPGPASAASGSASSDGPQLVSWSSDEVKQYFDPNVDWNIPYPDGEEEQTPPPEEQQAGAVTTNGTTVINHYGGYNSGFGWDDLLLYHMLFNAGSNYSARSWYNNHPSYYAGTKKVYKPSTYSSGTFVNKPVVGSVAKPKTSTSSTGSITRRGTSSKAGGIGGNSSKLGSSGSSKSSLSSGSKSGGFGG